MFFILSFGIYLLIFLALVSSEFCKSLNRLLNSGTLAQTFNTPDNPV